MTIAIDDKRALLWAMLCVRRERIENLELRELGEDIEAVLNEWIESVGVKNVRLFVNINPLIATQAALDTLQGKT